MKLIVIRHGFTGVDRNDRNAFGIQGPPLDKLGQKQALLLHATITKLGFDTQKEPVAVSELLRTKHTAELAGFSHIRSYAVLNEVITNLPAEEVKRMLQAKQVPEEAVRRAKMVLENPPKEKIWIVHGLLIVGIRAVLGIEREPFVPDFCEISYLNI